MESGNVSDNLEIEVKIKIESIERVKEKIKAAGFSSLHPRVFEYNVVYDTPAKTLKKKKFLLRLRRINNETLLTFKRPYRQKGLEEQNGVHKTKDYKIREEFETGITDFDTMQTIIMGLGYAPWFIYEKYREEFQQGNVRIMMDETPIGSFIEIEGPVHRIDETAELLGFNKDDYITSNYRTLFKKAGGKGHMTFTQDGMLRE